MLFDRGEHLKRLSPRVTATQPEGHIHNGDFKTSLRPIVFLAPFILVNSYGRIDAGLSKVRET
jgi:hypothetical protein